MLKRSKCKFAKNNVDILGYTVSRSGISPMPEKVQATQELAHPESVKEVRSFLGMANYYRQTIPDYAKIAEPMVALTRKGVDFVWSEQTQTSFETLKSCHGLSRCKQAVSFIYGRLRLRNRGYFGAE